MKIVYRKEYMKWYFSLATNEHWQIQNRLENIEREGYFGHYKRIGKSECLWELKWKCGRRIYFTFFDANTIVLLNGGNKNGQKKDIVQARKIIRQLQDL